MNKKKLLEILEQVEDDFEIELFHSRLLSSEELEGMSYPFPMVWDKYTIDETRDIGHSSKIISFEISETD